MPEESVISFVRDTSHLLDVKNLWQEAQFSEVVQNRTVGKYGVPALNYAACLMGMTEQVISGPDAAYPFQNVRISPIHSHSLVHYSQRRLVSN